jgi:hyperosmotically inducible protein
MKLQLVAALIAAPLLMQASVPSSPPAQPQTKIEKAVRHELVMLPYYNIFDDLRYTVDGDHVTLIGSVTRPTLKSDAGNVVKRIEGVRTVTNQIEVLPLSPMDNRIRFAAMRAIYGFPSLQRYGAGTMPPIHIIVKNGNITLTGVVANEADKNVAYIRAMGVFGAFSVKNELAVERHT